MTDNTVHTPTKEEAWERFWDIIIPALVDLHREGKLPPRPSLEAA